MPTPLLPNLKENHKVSIKRSGEWMSLAQNTIKDLKDDLQVGISTETDISSIPDIWAHPKKYEDILKDSTSPLYQDYVAKWRGIIAILALRCARGLKNIRLNKVTIPDASNFKGNEPRFLKVVAKLIPESLKNGVSKEDLVMQVITIDDKPLAFIWPELLICPSIGLDNIAIDNISWWNEGKILDPIRFLSDSERYLLSIWIDNVKGPVEDKALMGLLIDFKNDLNAPKNGPTPVAGTKLGIVGSCELLDYAPMPPKMSDSSIQESHVRLVTKKGAKDKNLLVITSDMDQQWNILPNKIVVAGNATFDVVSNNCFGGSIMGSDRTIVNGNDISEFNAVFCSTNDFLTDKIAISYANTDLFPKAAKNIDLDYDNKKAKVILPIRSQVLDYLDIDWLSNHIFVDVKKQTLGDSSSDIEVKLEVPLSGENNQIRLLTLTKVYSKSLNEIVECDAVPNVQIWPDFITADAENWKLYYSFYNIRNDLRNRAFYAEPCWDDKTVVKMDNKATNTYSEIIQGDSFPEAFCCYTLNKNLAGIEEKKEIGLIILRTPTPISTSSGNNDYTIGVDFGTTNTIAYCSTENNAPEIIRFADRLYPIVDYKNENELRRNFFSDVEQPNGEKNFFIRSVFHNFKYANNVDSNAPLSRGNIYYLKNCEDITKDKLMKDELHDDMKWSTKGVEDKRGFLSQYCMQCMAEAVANGATSIKWMYSFPESFTTQERNNTKYLWNNSIMKVLDGISALNTGKVKSKTESLSMLEYFKEGMDAKVITGIVCLDIGGGSTDIAVWQNNKTEEDPLRYQCSIKFAGRNILNNYLFAKKEKNKELWTSLTIGHDNYDNQLSRVNTSKKADFNMHIEALLKYYEPEIFTNLLDRSMDPKVAIILRDVAFAISGLFYYTGGILAYLKDNNRYDSTDTLPNFYIGGNGSKLLNWPSKGDYRNDDGNPFQDVLINCLLAGIIASAQNGEEAIKDIEDVPIIRKTDDPKQEVAYGLVCNTYLSASHNNNDNNKPVASKSLISNLRSKKMNKNSELVSEEEKEELMNFAGEHYSIDNQEVDELVIAKEKFTNGQSTITVGKACPIFHDFVNSFNSVIKDLGYTEVVFSDKDYKGIVNDVNEKLMEKRGKAQTDPDTVEIEPLFIMLLDRAMNILAERNI